MTRCRVTSRVFVRRKCSFRTTSYDKSLKKFEKNEFNFCLQATQPEDEYTFDLTDEPVEEPSSDVSLGLVNLFQHLLCPKKKSLFLFFYILLHL